MTDPITKLRELAEEMKAHADEGEVRTGISHLTYRSWADRLHSAIRLLGQREPIAWLPEVGADFLAACGMAMIFRDREHRDDVTPLYLTPAPDGMVLVPLEPTLNMIAAGNTRIWKDRETNAGFNSEDVWGAMLNAHRESGK